MRHGQGRVQKAATHSVRDAEATAETAPVTEPDGLRASERCLSDEPGDRGTGQAPEQALDQPRGGNQFRRPRGRLGCRRLCPGRRARPSRSRSPAPHCGMRGERTNVCKITLGENFRNVRATRGGQRSPVGRPQKTGPRSARESGERGGVCESQGGFEEGAGRDGARGAREQEPASPRPGLQGRVAEGRGHLRGAAGEG